MPPKVEIVDVSGDGEEKKTVKFSFIDFINRNKFVSIIGVLAVLFFLLGLFGLVMLKNRTVDKEVQIIHYETETQSSAIYVDLSGAVMKPGLYHLKSDSRINDLLSAAGGLTAEAERARV